MASGPCFVVIGMDPVRVVRCVGLEFKDLAAESLGEAGINIASGSTEQEEHGQASKQQPQATVVAGVGGCTQWRLAVGVGRQRVFRRRGLFGRQFAFCEQALDTLIFVQLVHGHRFSIMRIPCFGGMRPFSMSSRIWRLRSSSRACSALR